MTNSLTPAKQTERILRAMDHPHFTLLANLRYGVGQARRGWLERSDVLNTRPLAALRKLFKRTM